MRTIIAVVVLLTAQALVAKGNDAELKHARRYGADAKIILRCVDQDGGVVTNAVVSTALYPDGSFEHAIVRNGRTDTNGVFVMEGKTNGEFTYSLEKDGHYKTREQKFLFAQPGVSISDGRWQPYGATNTVVLKRKVNPVAMCVRRKGDGILPPVKNEFLGFDLERGDWVAPHGAGKVGDLRIKYECEPGVPPQLYCRSVVTLSFTNRFDGAYRLEKEPFNAFPSVYRAATNELYLQELRFAYDRLSGKPKEDTRLPDSGYLVLRTRSVTDKDGNLVSAHYSKMYGPVEADVGGIYFSSYFNPNANDPNLEADTTKNLLNPRDLGFPP